MSSSCPEIQATLATDEKNDDVCDVGGLTNPARRVPEREVLPNALIHPPRIDRARIEHIGRDSHWPELPRDRYHDAD